MHNVIWCRLDAFFIPGSGFSPQLQSQFQYRFGIPIRFDSTTQLETRTGIQQVFSQGWKAFIIAEKGLFPTSQISMDSLSSCRHPCHHSCTSKTYPDTQKQLFEGNRCSDRREAVMPHCDWSPLAFHGVHPLCLGYSFLHYINSDLEFLFADN